MEFTQSEVAENYLRRRWPDIVEDAKQIDAYDKAREEIEAQYGLLDRLNPRSSYDRNAVKELARNPDNPGTEEAEALNRELRLEKDLYLERFSGPGWDLDWLEDFLEPLRDTGTVEKDDGMFSNPDRSTWRWDDMEIGLLPFDPYVTFEFDPIKDPDKISQLSNLYGTDVEFDVVNEGQASGEEIETEAERYALQSQELGDVSVVREDVGGFFVDYEENRFGLRFRKSSLGDDAEFEEGIARLMETLQIMGWEDQKGRFELSSASDFEEYEDSVQQIEQELETETV